MVSKKKNPLFVWGRDRKARNAKKLSSGQIFLSHPHPHDRFDTYATSVKLHCCYLKYHCVMLTFNLKKLSTFGPNKIVLMAYA